ncbi:MAG: Branched-chain amino acid transporter, amino acid-binding protein [Solirubrobacterales bacterium]|nr:Branched-chain amino acid transporter, amino acid-binding protein [Solirubrobacterales bacterium]
MIQGRFRVLRRTLVAATALAAMALPATAAFAPGLAQATSSANTALIDEESVTNAGGLTKEGTSISLEQHAAEAAGYTVTLRSGTEWEAMSASEFAAYQVLIVGDPSCGGTALSAVESAHTWTPVVMGAGPNPLVGNRVVVGTDPEYHYSAGHLGAEHLVQDGIAFAGGVAGATGVYFDTSCTDLQESKQEEEERLAGADLRPAEVTQPILEGPDGRDKNDILEHLTEAPSKEAWTEDTEPPCGGEVQQVAANPVFDTGETKLLDSDIQGWGCSVHIAFPTFPTDFFPLAVDLETGLKPTCGTDPETAKEVCGEAYVLLAGQGIVAEAPNLTLTPASATSPAGGSHTVTAYVHKEEKPVAEAVVGFAVTGQNRGVSGTCTTGAGAPDPECKTDVNGEVKFTYNDSNGVGNDTIDASVTLETTVEEETIDVRPAAVTSVVKTTERATAAQQWTPVITPAPATVAPVTTPTAKSAVLAFGAARLASNTHACVASSGYLASVSGKLIGSVTFTLDGHKIRTLRKANLHGSYVLRIAVKAGHVHHLTIHVVFTSVSSTKALTIHRTLARCAVRHHVATPRFTG